MTLRYMHLAARALTDSEAVAEREGCLAVLAAAHLGNLLADPDGPASLLEKIMTELGAGVLND